MLIRSPVKSELLDSGETCIEKCFPQFVRAPENLNVF